MFFEKKKILIDHHEKNKNDNCLTWQKKPIKWTAITGIMSQLLFKTLKDLKSKLLQQKKKMNSKLILALLLVVGVANLQADTTVPKCFGKGKNTCQN
jgi:hypothetical protein